MNEDPNFEPQSNSGSNTVSKTTLSGQFKYGVVKSGKYKNQLARIKRVHANEDKYYNLTVLTDLGRPLLGEKNSQIIMTSLSKSSFCILELPNSDVIVEFAKKDEGDGKISVGKDKYVDVELSAVQSALKEKRAELAVKQQRRLSASAYATAGSPMAKSKLKKKASNTELASSAQSRVASATTTAAAAKKNSNSTAATTSSEESGEDGEESRFVACCVLGFFCFICSTYYIY